jgi:hypothetical protein
MPSSAARKIRGKALSVTSRPAVTRDRRVSVEHFAADRVENQVEWAVLAERLRLKADDERHRRLRRQPVLAAHVDYAEAG